VAEAERELEVRAPQLHAVADAVDLELALVALRDALHQVVEQRARQAVQRAALPLVVGALDREHALVERDRDRLVDLVAQGALRALDRDVLPVDGDVDARRHGDRGLADA